MISSSSAVSVAEPAPGSGASRVELSAASAVPSVMSSCAAPLIAPSGVRVSRAPPHPHPARGERVALLAPLVGLARFDHAGRAVRELAERVDVVGVERALG